MKIAATPVRRRALVALLALLLAGGLSALLLARDAERAGAEAKDSQTLCKGHIKAGEPDPDDPDLTVVQYRFACSGPLTGFQIQPDKEVQSFETELFALDRTTNEVVQTDAMFCTGDQPGYGLNCTGTYGGEWRVLQGTFTIDGKLCDEPRVDPLLTVLNASITSALRINQSMAGPFDLGRPRGCPKSAGNGKWRIPRDKEPDVVGDTDGP